MLIQNTSDRTWLGCLSRHLARKWVGPVWYQNPKCSNSGTKYRTFWPAQIYWHRPIAAWYTNTLLPQMLHAAWSQKNYLLEQKSGQVSKTSTNIGWLIIIIRQFIMCCSIITKQFTVTPLCFRKWLSPESSLGAQEDDLQSPGLITSTDTCWLAQDRSQWREIATIVKARYISLTDWIHHNDTLWILH